MSEMALIDPVAATVSGFVPKPRYRRAECDWLEAEEGSEPLWAEVRSDLPLGAIDRIPRDGSCTYNEMWDAIAPHVRAWNAMGQDPETGEWKPVPPPAEIGRDAFALIDPMVSYWIRFLLLTTYAKVGSDPKASAPSAPTETPASEPASISSARASKSRKSQRGSA